MKNHKYLLVILLFSLVCACNNDDSSDEPELLAQSLGFDFRKVDFMYTDHQDGIQYVNATPGVQSIHNAPNSIKAQHWVYKSPSLEDQEIGFSVVYASECENSPCEVILFLHGSEGSENSGATLFFDYYAENKSEIPRAFIFANGIYAPNSPISSGVWKDRAYEQKNLDHPQQILELLGGIVEDDSLFPFLTRDMANWSVVGFSAGASGVMGIYMDDGFNQNSQYMPMHYYPLGGWMTDSLHDYFDFTDGLNSLKDCDNNGAELILANHLEDDVDCEGAKQFQSKEYLVEHLLANEVPFTYLGLTDEGVPCELGADHNPVHSVKFYLRNSIATSIQNVNCEDADYLENYEVLGDLLYRSY